MASSEGKGRRRIAHLVVVAVAAFGVGANTLAFDFVWDENQLLLPMEAYRTFDLNEILFSLANNLEYLPVRDLSYAADYAVWGPRPFGFHLTNVVLYALNAVVVYVLTRRLLRMLFADRHSIGRHASECALATALLFAVHPIHSEVMSFITCRNVLLSGLFFFLSTHLFLGWMGGASARRTYAASVVCGLLAFLSKATAIILPGVLFLAVVMVPGRSRRRLVALLPFVGLAAGMFFVFRAVAEHSGIVDTENVIDFGVSSWSSRIALAAQIPFFYLGKLLVPAGFSTAYADTFVRDLADARVILALAGLTALVGTALVLRGKRPDVATSLGWYFVALLPVLNFFATAPVVADRYAYLPSFAVVLAATTLACGLTTRVPRPVIWGGGAVVVLVLALLAVNRNAVWENDGTLWEATLRESPDAGGAHRNLADFHFRRGERAAGFDVLERWVASGGDEIFLQYFRARDAFARDDFGAVERGLGSRSDADAFEPEMFLLLGRALERLGKPEGALAIYLKALDRHGVDPLGYLQKVARRLEAVQRRLSGGLAAKRQEVQRAPGDLNRRVELALALDRLGLYDEALRHYRELLRRGGENWMLHFNLANIYKKTGRPEEAVRHYRACLALNRKNADAWNNLGILLRRRREYDGAIEAFEAAARVSPTFANAPFNLATLHFRLGHREEARRCFERVVAAFPQLRDRARPYLDKLR